MYKNRIWCTIIKLFSRLDISPHPLLMRKFLHRVNML